MKDINLKNFIHAYLEAALWASIDDNDDPFDSNYSLSDFSPDAMQKTQRDCEQFLTNEDLTNKIKEAKESYDYKQAGHDFFLTRNRHGTGFWDRKELEAEELGERLTDYTHKHFKEVSLFAGDSGKLYFE